MALAALSPGPAGGVAVVAARYGEREAVRVEEHLVSIEAQAAFRSERAVRAIAVALAGTDAGHEDVPVAIRPVYARSSAMTPAGAAPSRSKSSSSTRVACFEKTLKFTPSGGERSRRAARRSPRPVATAAGAELASAASFARVERSHVPDVAAVVTDRPIGRESPDSRAVQNRHPRPCRWIGVGLAHAPPGSPRRPGSRRTAGIRRASGATRRADGTYRDRPLLKGRRRSGRSFRELGVRLVHVARPVTGGFFLRDFRGLESEQEEFSAPTASRISTLHRRACRW